MPAIDKTEFVVDVQALGEEGAPLMITQNEFMRRMKDMSQFQPGMGFYSQFPDSYTLVLNTDHPLIKDVLKSTQEATASELKPVLSEIKGQEARLQVLQQQQVKRSLRKLLRKKKLTWKLQERLFLMSKENVMTLLLLTQRITMWCINLST